MDEEKQVRMTLFDCLINQDKITGLVKQLIMEERALTIQEKKVFKEALHKALISQGMVNPVFFVKDKGWFVFESVQTLALRLCDLTTDRVELTTSRPENVVVTIPIAELWQFLYGKMLYLFPRAASEATHLSTEFVDRPTQGVFDFDAKEKL